MAATKTIAHKSLLVKIIMQTGHAIIIFKKLLLEMDVAKTCAKLQITNTITAMKDKSDVSHSITPS